MSTASSGYAPLIDAIKSAVILREGQTETLKLDLWLVRGQPREVRIRGRETFHVVSLSS